MKINKWNMRMGLKTGFLFISLSLFVFGALHAQIKPGGSEPSGVQKDQTVLGSREGEEVAESKKPDIRLPAIEIPVKTEGLTFDSLDIPAASTYNPPSPRVMPPEKEVWPALYSNYVKLGFGRFATPIGKLYLNNGRNADFDAGFDFTHISSSSGWVKYAESREDSGNARYSRHLKGQTVGLSFFGYNTSYYYFRDTLLEGSPLLNIQDSLNQKSTKFRGEINLIRHFDTSGVNYDVSLQFRNWFDRNKNRDIHLDLIPNFSWNMVKNLRAGIHSAIVYSNAQFDTLNESRFFLDISPSVLFSQRKIRLSGGVKINSYSDSSSVFGAFPFVRAEFDALSEILTVYAGYKGGMEYNRFYNLIGENRYLDLRANMKPSIEKYNVYFGLLGSFSKWFNYSLQFYSKKVENQVVFVSPFEGSHFAIVYDSAMIEKGLEFNLGLNWKDKARASLQVKARDFVMTNVPFNFAVPPIYARLNVNYNLANKIGLGTAIYFYGKRAMNLNSSGLPEYQASMADISFMADYRFSNRFSVFLECNNVLDNKFYRWYGYQERPFDIKGGLTFSF